MAPEGENENLTPLVIGVTGHRDLVPGQIDEIRDSIRTLFAELRKAFPNTPLRLMTALAEGADRLATYAAIDENVEVQVVLPMPADDYREDFRSEESKAEFDTLCAGARVIELPSEPGIHAVVETPDTDRNLSYADAGMFISAHCHILLAIWDGVQSDNIGGTAQVIHFQHYDRLPGIAESVPRTSLFLTDDESDLVYEIRCSRNGNAVGEAALTPVEACWFTTDPQLPRTKSLPPRYVRVFKRTDEYNSDILRSLARSPSKPAATKDLPETGMQAAAADIRQYFEVANSLANHYQKRVERTLRALYTFALLTGLTFIVFSEVNRADSLIYAFLAFILLAIMLSAVARRREWHRKYLDYRVLAEGLRVQFYWSIAGVHGEGHTKFAYDNFLRQRDMELGWIRNVMRVAGTMNDAQLTEGDVAGLQFAIDHWIGSEDNPGQLGYYREKSAQRSRINRATDSVTVMCLWGGIVVALILALFLGEMSDGVQDAFIILMGILPLFAGVAEVYTQRKADRELVKQYRFMEHIFANANRRLKDAVNDAERREVLQGLGEAALSEHAEWILVHRERQPEPAGIA